MTTNTITLPDFTGPAPINYRDFRESIALALDAEGVDNETICTALLTVDDAIVANKTELVWDTDHITGEGNA